MKFYIDDGNTEKIRKLYDTGVFRGVSTNPSIISKSKRNPLELINEILDITDGILFVQALSNHYDDLLKEAAAISKICQDRIVVKIPFSTYGLKAAKELENRSVRTLITAIYSFEQGALAVESGAEFIAPYVNRMINAGTPVDHVLMMQQYIERHDKDCEIVAASFKNLEQIRTVIDYGIDSITISTDLYEAIFGNILIEKAIRDFESDWNSIPGKNWVI
ncbi:MAG TPA: transaldolase family protein [Thermotogota bacterium]|nr:transaldolase family protein [Thermotogota bacterium]HPJ88978.1 transaldolase family protein [Thermotogota bacterium]HPR97259.1 transaldolase family protein [Thermotogota bacterium]